MIEYLTKNGSLILLDDEDYPLTKVAWGINSVGYARRTIRVKENGGKHKTLLMHRHIMDAKAGEVVDHINGNKLDNRRSNLRLCTQSENLLNRHKLSANKTSKYFGVSRSIEKRWKTNRVSWHVQLMTRNGRVSKKFSDEISAMNFAKSLRPDMYEPGGAR